MGTGEPFDNYDNVMRFCEIINSDHGLAIGARHITISTCGIVPKIKDFAQGHYQYNLAISLHAPNDELRQKLMPVDQAYPLDVLMERFERNTVKIITAG
jgi:23S rRNA (adenine2503-C2)-methyltransferase